MKKYITLSLYVDYVTLKNDIKYLFHKIYKLKCFIYFLKVILKFSLLYISKHSISYFIVVYKKNF